MPEIQASLTFPCPVCETPVPVGATRCPNVNCKEDLSSLAALNNAADASYRKAMGLIKENKIPQAMELLHNVSGLEPERVDVWVVLGKLYAQSRDYSAATSCWQKALELQPGEGRATAGLSQIEKLKRNRNIARWLGYGSLVFLILVILLLVGRMAFAQPTNPANAAKSFAGNPVFAAYHVEVRQDKNNVALLGSVPGEPEKQLIIAAAQMAMPAATIDGSELVVALATPTPVPTLPTPTQTASPTETLVPTPVPSATPRVCQVTTFIKNGSLNIRASGSVDAKIIGVAQDSSLLTVTGSMDRNGWVPVKAADGLAGWVNYFYCR